MRALELSLKAAGDPTRTRILKLLEGGGLCVCQIQAVLGLSPSTISKHLTILRHAGMVEDKRDGKWIEYALTAGGANPYAGRVLALLRGSIDREPVVVADRKRLREVKAIPLIDLCSAMPARRTASSSVPVRRSPTKARSR